jgi:CRP-like cAMP-binding protein
MPRRFPIDPEIARVPLFADLSRKELALASRLSTPVSLPPGQVLARQGAIGAEFFVVLSGQVDVLQNGDLIAQRGAGAPLGEIALLGARPRTATLVARTDVDVLVVAEREFRSLLVGVPHVATRLHSTMTERLAA